MIMASHWLSYDNLSLAGLWRWKGEASLLLLGGKVAETVWCPFLPNGPDMHEEQWA